MKKQQVKGRKGSKVLRVVVESPHGEHKDTSDAIVRRLQQLGYEVEVQHH